MNNSLPKYLYADGTKQSNLEPNMETWVRVSCERARERKIHLVLLVVLDVLCWIQLQHQ